MSNEVFWSTCPFPGASGCYSCFTLSETKGLTGRAPPSAEGPTVMGFSDLCSFWLPCKLLAECFATQFLPAALCIAHCEKQNDALPEKLSNQRAACLLLLVSFVCWSIVSKGVTDTSNHNCSPDQKLADAVYNSRMSPSCPFIVFIVTICIKQSTLKVFSRTMGQPTAWLRAYVHACSDVYIYSLKTRNLYGLNFITC